MANPGSGFTSKAFPGTWAEQGKWRDELCTYEWHVNIVYNGLYECLCEEGDTSPAALVALETLEERAMSLARDERNRVISTMAAWVLPIWIIPLLIHTIWSYYSWRARA